MLFALIVIGGFVLMEPLTAATHRWVMHGIGEWFHRSHHRASRAPGWERNDWFPVAFASIVMFGFWIGFNTTLTALVPLAATESEPQRLVVANVGDSRAYLLRGSELKQVSADHSYVQELLTEGLITADEARVHPRRNIVTRALGIEGDVNADSWTLPMVIGDRYILCSDGLVDEVDDNHIELILRSCPDPQQAADQ